MTRSIIDPNGGVSLPGTHGAGLAGELSRDGFEGPDLEAWDTFLHPATAEMIRLRAQIRLIAPQETNVLLVGETGTGKTRLAGIIHKLSPRRCSPYLVVNCAALSENLIESEMFGHVRGAFTGADRDRTGKFAEVGRGTLLLDEIDSLPLALQSKLLRAVEERVFEQVGSNTSMPIQARLIAASSRPLGGEVAAGRFRADLYFRLSVVEFSLPPLRERLSAIRALAMRFIHELSAHHDRDVRGIAPDAVRILQTHDWPGNIRELRNVLERAVSLCSGPEIQAFDLPDSLRSGAPRMIAPLPLQATAGVGQVPGSRLAQVKKEAEVARIIEALHRNKDNRLRAAEELGISRMTLYKKLHKYGLMGQSSLARPQEG
jgi:two-component system response regulator HydG